MYKIGKPSITFDVNTKEVDLTGDIDLPLFALGNFLSRSQTRDSFISKMEKEGSSENTNP